MKILNLPPQKDKKCKLILPKPMIEEIPDDDEWKNQTINSIDDDMDLLISYIIGDMERIIWINTKSTMAMEIQAEINLKKKVLPLEEEIPKEFHNFLDVFSEKKAASFLESRPWDHKTKLKDTFTPKYTTTFNFSFVSIQTHVSLSTVQHG